MCRVVKWASGLFCDKKIPLKFKEKFYRMAARPALMYESECWTTNYEHEQRM